MLATSHIDSKQPLPRIRRFVTERRDLDRSAGVLNIEPVYTTLPCSIPAARSASWAIRAGVQLFYLSRVMGTSVAQIDATYGHLVPDSDNYVRWPARCLR